MSVTLYADRDGDIWAADNRGRALLIVERGGVVRFPGTFDTAVDRLSAVAEELGPLRRLDPEGSDR